MRRNATREIVQVNFQTRHGNRTWAVFGNHWPSRSGGQHESAGYRQIAGETLAYFHQRVLEVHGPDTPVLAMGDFNDEPFDTSLVTHALSERQHNRVVNARNPTLLNLMWPLIGGHRQGPAPHQEPDGTFYYNNEPNMLDQFLANKHMITSSAPIRVDETSVEIVRFPGMFNERSDYPAPIPFGRPPETNHSPDGYSDHFPISLRITEE